MFVHEREYESVLGFDVEHAHAWRMPRPQLGRTSWQSPAHLLQHDIPQGTSTASPDYPGTLESFAVSGVASTDLALAMLSSLLCAGYGTAELCC